MRLLRLALAAPGLSTLAGCLLTIDDARVGEGDAAALDSGIAADATGDVQGDVAGEPSADGDGGPRCPAGMLVVPTPAGGDYCIDATEVTHAAYAAFLGSAPAPTTSNQLAECAWNTTFQPDQWNAGSDPALPVNGIDWCDAYAYCTAVPGRHLCGAIGGGAVEYQTGIFDANKAEWFNACSHQGQNAFPYAGSYDGTRCNGADFGAGAARDAGSIATCVGGFSGLFDMSGNVEEWANSCISAGSTCSVGAGHQCDLCRGLGGAYDTGATFLPCKGGDQFYRAAQFTDTGVRCCAD